MHYHSEMEFSMQNSPSKLFLQILIHLIKMLKKSELFRLEFFPSKLSDFGQLPEKVYRLSRNFLPVTQHKKKLWQKSFCQKVLEKDTEFNKKVNIVCTTLHLQSYYNNNLKQSLIASFKWKSSLNVSAKFRNLKLNKNLKYHSRVQTWLTRT